MMLLVVSGSIANCDGAEELVGPNGALPAAGIGDSRIVLGIGGAQQLLPVDASGAALGSVTWRSTDTMVATVSPDGVVVGKTWGKTLVFATTGSRVAASWIAVQDYTPSMAIVSPARLDVSTGTTTVTTTVRGTSPSVALASGTASFLGGKVSKSCTLRRRSGNAHDGIWSCETTFGAADVGSYRPSVALTDSAGAGRFTLDFAGFYSPISVLQSSERDAPKLTVATITLDTVSIGASTPVLYTPRTISPRISVWLTDPSGIGFVLYVFTPPTGSTASTQYLGGSCNTNQSGITQCVADPRFTLESVGTWTVGVYASDVLSNSVWYTSAQLAAAGISSSLRVVP